MASGGDSTPGQDLRRAAPMEFENPWVVEEIPDFHGRVTQPSLIFLSLSGAIA